MQATTFRMVKKGPNIYSTGDYLQYPVINHNGKNSFKKECILVYD